MIFATCGSSPMAFERMMHALEALSAEELIVQHGPATPPASAESYPFLPFGRIVELMQEADLVVSHAGVGSIMCALQAGHMPIVFPRYHRFGETVDDHQAELAEALAARGTVIVASTAEQLLDAAANAPRRGLRRTLHGQQLSAAVRAAIRGERPQALRARAANVAEPMSGVSSSIATAR